MQEQTNQYTLNLTLIDEEIEIYSCLPHCSAWIDQILVDIISLVLTISSIECWISFTYTIKTLISIFLLCCFENQTPKNNTQIDHFHLKHCTFLRNHLSSYNQLTWFLFWTHRTTHSTPCYAIILTTIF